MKKIILLIVCFVTLISVSSCTADSVDQDAQQTGEVSRDKDRNA